MDHTESTPDNATADNPIPDNAIIVGFFDQQVRAERALHDLHEAGFTSANIGLAHRTARPAAPNTATPTNEAERAWEKVKSFFQGHSAGERTREVADTRELPPASSYDTTSGYSHDDLHRSLISLGLDEPRARYFGQRLHSTDYGAVVTVNASGRANLAEFILRDNGADLGESAPDAADDTVPASEYIEQQRATPQPAAVPTETYKTQSRPAEAVQPVSNDQPLAARETNIADQPNRTGDMQNIQLLGEVLRVHKEKIDRGEVTVRKNVVTETKTIEVPVRREELVIEQRAPAGDARSGGTPGQQIRIPLSEETASIDKRTVVREDVTVGKKPVQEIQDMSGEVRHEELVVDDRTKRAVNE